MRTYEAMFLFDPSFAADMSKVEQEVGRLMQRAGAEIIMSDKWDERKLAYPIRHIKRGVYVLVYFRADGSVIGQLRHTINLSEEILRVLILKAEKMDPPKGQLYSPEGEPVKAEQKEAETEPAAEQSEGAGAGSE